MMGARGQGPGVGFKYLKIFTDTWPLTPNPCF